MVSYHAAACELLDVTSVIDDTAQAVVHTHERQLGVSLPAAVAEWYALNAAQDRVAAADSDTHYRLADLGRPRWPTDTHDFRTEGLLPIRTENQGVCHWAVPLDEGDDPQVLVEVDSDPDNPTWDLYARSFTEYLFTLAWDLHAFAMPYNAGAQESQFAHGGLLLLEAGFHRQPTTFAWPGAANHRFERGGQRVIVWDTPSPRPRHQTDWWLMADSPQAFRDLLTTLWHCGELANHLYDNSANDDGILASLRDY